MDGPSTTALGAALMRAAHTRLDDPALIDDPWGDRLVLTEEREAMLVRLGAKDLDMALRTHPAYGAVILRTRYAEDSLADAVGHGVGQYVIVGAGMDSFSLRRPAFSGQLEIFEVDHPATQEFKADRLRAFGIELPAGVHLVPADLSEMGLDAALERSEYRSDRPAFFAWLGVTIYLTRAENLATLGAIASCAQAGSELVFEYADQRVLDAGGEQDRVREVREQVASAGEPWISGFDPDRLHEDLRGAGLELIENLGPDDLQTRYCTGRADGLTPSPSAHIARARVAA